jgi:hypothetical protein
MLAFSFHLLATRFSLLLLAACMFLNRRAGSAWEPAVFAPSLVAVITIASGRRGVHRQVLDVYFHDDSPDTIAPILVQSLGSLAGRH